MKIIEFSIANQFSETPGARYRSDGKYSGQEFYEDKLKSLFDDCIKNGSKLEINLDGTNGYATSFLDEAFGRLAEDFTPEVVFSNLQLISIEEPHLLNEIKDYISNAHK